MNFSHWLLSLLPCCCLPWFAAGQSQSFDLVRAKTVSAQFDIGITSSERPFTVTEVNAPDTGSVRIVGVAYSAGDLIVEIQVDWPQRSRKTDFTGISADLALKARPTADRQAVTIQATAQELATPVQLTPQRYQWRWPGIVERIRPFNGSYELQATVSLVGRFEVFPDTPRLTSHKLRYQYVAAGVGGLTIGASYLVQRNADRYYDDYLAAVTEAEAAPLYREANRRRRAYQLTRWVGATILLADVVVLLDRLLRVRRERAEYDFWYASRDRRLRWRPYYRPVSPWSGGEHAGFHFSYTLSK